MTWRIVRDEILNNNVKRFVSTELQQKGTQILQSNLDREEKRLRIVAIGKEITEASQQVAQGRMTQYGLKDYQLRVIQGAQTDSLMMLNNELTQASTNHEADRQKLLELSTENNELARQLNEYTRYEQFTQELRTELSALYPQIKTISLVKTAECSRDTTAMSHFTTAIISTNKEARLAHADLLKLTEWLKARTHADSLVVVEK
jgi:hypothetical protein